MSSSTYLFVCRLIVFIGVCFGAAADAFRTGSIDGPFYETLCLFTLRTDVVVLDDHCNRSGVWDGVRVGLPTRLNMISMFQKRNGMGIKGFNSPLQIVILLPTSDTLTLTFEKPGDVWISCFP